MLEKQIREDLKKIAKKNRDIAIMTRTKLSYEKRLEFLESIGSGEIAQTKRLITDITKRLEKTIVQTTSLESVYMDAIMHLQPLYRSAILDHYINGEVRHKVAEKANYSDSGMAKVLKEAVKRLTEELNKKTG